jgi:hypothetical protein
MRLTYRCGDLNNQPDFSSHITQFFFVIHAMLHILRRVRTCTCSLNVILNVLPPLLSPGSTSSSLPLVSMGLSSIPSTTPSVTPITPQPKTTSTLNI